MAIGTLLMCSAKEAPFPHPSYEPLHAHGSLVSTRFARTVSASKARYQGSADNSLHKASYGGRSCRAWYGNTGPCRSFCVSQVHRPVAAAMLRPRARPYDGGSARQVLLDASPLMRADMIARPPCPMEQQTRLISRQTAVHVKARDYRAQGVCRIILLFPLRYHLSINVPLMHGARSGLIRVCVVLFGKTREHAAMPLSPLGLLYPMMTADDDGRRGRRRSP